MDSNLSFKLNRLPKTPGVYLWKDKYGQIIYVGKAKNIYNRVHQYFSHPHNDKTSLLVNNIYDIDFISVHNESEALILEANLIKKHNPKYNILLKNNNGYPYILLTKETHPRLLYTRDHKKNKGIYYGPFATTKSNRYDIYGSLLKLFPFRKCFTLPNTKCLYYDIGQCLGPCINKITPAQYQPYFKEVDDFFSGKPQVTIKRLESLEKQAADKLNFEEAQRNLMLKQTIMNASKEMAISQSITLRSSQNVDIIGYCVKNNSICIVIFSYVGGKLLAKHQQINDLYTKTQEAIQEYLIQYYYKTYNHPKKCYVNLSNIELKQLSNLIGINFIHPQSGKYKTILQLAAINAKNFMDSNYLIHKQTQSRTINAFNELRQILSIDNLSLIHVFDMSNLFGNDRIGAMIGLENGAFNKNLYRKFIIKDLNAKSDYDYMYETIKRQYTKLIKERTLLPNLIMVDGGTIQINAAIKALTELNLQLVIPVIGLTKDHRHKTRSLLFANKKTIILDRKSNLYMYLFNIQEEVHRYAINFFRKRSKNSMFKSVLNDIPGLGEKSINKLLQHYDNIANIQNANVSELSQFVPPKIAQSIKSKLSSWKK